MFPDPGQDGRRSTWLRCMTPPAWNARSGAPTAARFGHGGVAAVPGNQTVAGIRPLPLGEMVTAPS